MKQRAALARALALDPVCLMLDEPFGSLDAISRAEMRNRLLEVWNKGQTTMVFVTHDIDEAVELADRVLIMDGPPGRIALRMSITLPRPRVVDGVRVEGFELVRNSIAQQAGYLFRRNGFPDRGN
jgi:NitT/TauT family transport system ATP-binding protein